MSHRLASLCALLSFFVAMNAVVGTSSCAKPARPVRLTFAGEADAVFSAVMRTLVASGWAINAEDRRGGVIQTEYQNISSPALYGIDRRLRYVVLVEANTLTVHPQTVLCNPACGPLGNLTRDEEKNVRALLVALKEAVPGTAVSRPGSDGTADVELR